MHLARTHPEIFDDWQVLHLAGESMQDEVRGAYDASGVRSVVHAFVDRMCDVWGAADLAISRSGANSVAEVHANHVPTIFVPYPYHKDMHQRRNALPLVDLGGSLVVDDGIEVALTTDRLLPVLRSLMSDDDARVSMRTALMQSAPTDGALQIAECVLGEQA